MNIYKNEDGFYVIVGIGSYLYLPKEMQNQSSVDFCTDYFEAVEVSNPVELEFMENGEGNHND